MESVIIVGGGLGGLLAARLLKNHQVSFQGLEKTGLLGGRFGVGHHRIYERETLSTINSYFPNLKWSEVSDEPQERGKGEWVALQGNFTEAQSFYLKFPFFEIEWAGESERAGWLFDLKDNFKTRQKVVSVDTISRKVFVDGGIQYSYERILWCAPLELLLKLEKGTATVNKRVKKCRSAPGGLSINLVVDSPILSTKNSSVFRFRFKDKWYNAMGFPSMFSAGDTHKQRVEWLIFLDEGVLENREEVAKVVRAFERELIREFVGLKCPMEKKKITYLPHISGEPPIEVDSLEIFPDVYYVGSQLRRTGSSLLQNIDLVVRNVKHLESELYATT